MQGIDASDAHSALADAELTAKILKIVKNKQEHTWEFFLRTANKSDTETIMKKGEIVTLNEYYYGKSRLHLVVPLHQKHCMHPIYHGKLGAYNVFDVMVQPNEVWICHNNIHLK